jgi:hypothetical protein
VEKIPKEKIAIILLQNPTKSVIFAVDYFAWRVDWTKTSVTSKSVRFFTFIEYIWPAVWLYLLEGVCRGRVEGDV